LLQPVRDNQQIAPEPDQNAPPDLARLEQLRNISCSLFRNYSLLKEQLQIEPATLNSGFIFAGGVSTLGIANSFAFESAAIFLARFLNQTGWVVPQGALRVEEMLIMTGRNYPTGAYAFREVLRSANYSDDVFARLVGRAARLEMDSSINAVRSAQNGTFTYQAYTEAMDDVGQTLARGIRAAEGPASSASASNVVRLPAARPPSPGLSAAGLSRVGTMVGTGLSCLLTGILGAILMDITWKAMQESEMYRNDYIA
jgi:hypothetical protein